MSFFRLCIYICLGLILVAMFISFVGGLGAFNVYATPGMSGFQPSNILQSITHLSNGMEYIWAAFTSISMIGAGFVAWMVGSFTPIVIDLFGTVFWTSYINATSVLYVLIPPELAGLIAIIHLVVGVIFIAACIGMGGGSD